MKGTSYKLAPAGVWSQSADGSALSIVSTRGTPMGEMKVELVYDKAK